MRKFIALVFGLMAVVFSGCGTFNREWEAARATPPPTSDITGPWEGRWLSDKNGHTGALRAVLRKSGNSDELEAHFHANFWKIFRSTYRVPLKYNEKDGLYTLSGESDLGVLSGGVYTYEGEATPTRFFSTYKCKWDHGTFEMERPKDPQTNSPPAVASAPAK